jgi:hypothetical protein
MRFQSEVEVLILTTASRKAGEAGAPFAISRRFRCVASATRGAPMVRPFD